MLADNDYCRRDRTMMHVGEGVLFRRKYREETKVYGGLYCNKIAMREKWNRDLSSLSSRTHWTCI